MKKTGKNQEKYSKNGTVGQLFDFWKQTVKQTEEGTLLLKRTEKGTTEGSSPQKGTGEGTEGS